MNRRTFLTNSLVACASLSCTDAWSARGAETAAGAGRPFLIAHGEFGSNWTMGVEGRF